MSKILQSDWSRAFRIREARSLQNNRIVKNTLAKVGVSLLPGLWVMNLLVHAWNLIH